MFRKKKKSAPVSPEGTLSPAVPAPPAFDGAEPPEGMNGLALAFLGDAVYELMARSFILGQSGGSVQTLHEKTVSFSNAAFQSRAAKALAPHLTEAEAAVFRRGRNTRPGHVPKNKTQADYHFATGLEALFGWLYIQKDTKRLETLFSIVVKCSEEYEHGKNQN